MSDDFRRRVDDIAHNAFVFIFRLLAILLVLAIGFRFCVTVIRYALEVLR